MGVVYEGWDERLGRSVAIKTLHQSSSNPEALSRLWREARSLARVSHPGVARFSMSLKPAMIFSWFLSFWMANRWRIASPGA